VARRWGKKKLAKGVHWEHRTGYAAASPTGKKEGLAVTVFWEGIRAATPQRVIRSGNTPTPGEGKKRATGSTKKKGDLNSGGEKGTGVA